MQLDFSKNFFELFGLVTGFELDEKLLHERWQNLQKAVHPDRFVSGSDAERRYSMQAASLINEAHKVLRSPIDRAGYLLKLRDIDLDVETDTRMAPDFLMDQMELRERIDDIKSADDPYPLIDQLRDELRKKSQKTASAFGTSYGADDLQSARESVRQWQFLDKLSREVSSIEAKFDDEQ